MIKIKVEEKREEEFPIIKKNRVHGFIVLFIERQAGTVIQDKSGNYSIGEFCSSWSPYDNKLEWEHFFGDITISQ